MKDLISFSASLLRLRTVRLIWIQEKNNSIGVKIHRRGVKSFRVLIFTATRLLHGSVGFDSAEGRNEIKAVWWGQKHLCVYLFRPEITSKQTNQVYWLRQLSVKTLTLWNLKTKIMVMYENKLSISPNIRLSPSFVVNIGLSTLFKWSSPG